MSGETSCHVRKPVQPSVGQILGNRTPPTASGCVAHKHNVRKCLHKKCKHLRRTVTIFIYKHTNLLVICIFCWIYVVIFPFIEISMAGAIFTSCFTAQPAAVRKSAGYFFRVLTISPSIVSHINDHPLCVAEFGNDPINTIVIRWPFPKIPYIQMTNIQISDLAVIHSIVNLCGISQITYHGIVSDPVWSWCVVVPIVIIRNSFLVPHSYVAIPQQIHYFLKIVQQSNFCSF